jgi:hypothetical protein
MVWFIRLALSNLRSLARLNKTDFLNNFKINALGAAYAVQASLAAL